MKRVKLIWFALSHYAAYAQDRAGAELCGGEARRQRTMAHRDLTLTAIEALKADWQARA